MKPTFTDQQVEQLKVKRQYIGEIKGDLCYSIIEGQALKVYAFPNICLYGFRLTGIKRNDTII
ncbi:MAG: hypothetical protein RIC03_06850 [Cyclobacteriaceae bacterium]